MRVRIAVVKNLHTGWRRPGAALAALACAFSVTLLAGPQDPQPPSTKFRFRTGVDLVNVAVTVTDRQGRFVPSLRLEDFVVYEDNRPQPISFFANERVPVSLGLAIDTSGSMAGDKIVAAREALRRFLEDLTGPEDEVFVYRFGQYPELVQPWTSDRALLRSRIGSMRPNGGTAMYDTVEEAVSMAQTGQHRKKALVIISDGNDTDSSTTVNEVRLRIRETEVLVYAVGIGKEQYSQRRNWDLHAQSTLPPIQNPFPFPFPGGGTRRPQRPGQPPAGKWPWSADDGVNGQALREMTDDSGGRTEIVNSTADLGPATTRIADELSRQYFIGYAAAAPKDGRWHTIRVELRRGDYLVRARRGYTAAMGS